LIKDILNEYAESSSKEFSNDRTQTVGASEIGQCIRKVYWLKNENEVRYGTIRDEEHSDGWGARVRGNIYEDSWWYPALKRRFGDKLVLAGPDQTGFISGFLSATPDGLVTDLDLGCLKHLGVETILEPEILVECKTIDPRVKLDGPKPEHEFQAQVQIGMVRELTPYRPHYALITYTNASWWDDVLEFPVKFDPKIFAVAKQRAAKIMTATSIDELRPEGWISGGKECGYCPFERSCIKQMTTVPDVVGNGVDPQFVAEIADLALSYKQYKTAMEELDVKVRDAQYDLKERLRAKGVRQVSSGNVKVTWTSVKGRASWDNKAIREAATAAGVDVSQYETAGDPTDRLTVRIGNNP
jgi:hypothetical protein